MPKLEEMAVDVEEGLRQQAEARASPARSVRRKKVSAPGFLQIPVAWVKALKALPPLAHAMAFYLLLRRWDPQHRKETIEIEVGNITLKGFGITRYTKMPALRLLEGADLLNIELRGRCKSPVAILRKLE
jgi:hypothetical protein